MKVVLAPSWFAAAWRSLLFLGTMLLVAALMLDAKGRPQPSREVQRDEIRLFASRPISGTVQLGGEVLLLCGLTWACRGFLKIRL